MDDIREVRYLTDDRDEDKRNELVISQGGNGDWYVSVVREGQRTIGCGVRISTSGGASKSVPGLAPAIAAAFRALVEAVELVQKDVDQEPSCEVSGRCVAPKEAKGTTNCMYCGKELIERDGKWYTWDADLHSHQTPQEKE